MEEAHSLQKLNSADPTPLNTTATHRLHHPGERAILSDAFMSSPSSPLVVRPPTVHTWPLPFLPHSHARPKPCPLTSAPSPPSAPSSPSPASSNSTSGRSCARTSGRTCAAVAVSERRGFVSLGGVLRALRAPSHHSDDDARRRARCALSTPSRRARSICCRTWPSRFRLSLAPSLTVISQWQTFPCAWNGARPARARARSSSWPATTAATTLLRCCPAARRGDRAAHCGGARGRDVSWRGEGRGRGG